MKNESVSFENRSFKVHCGTTFNNHTPYMFMNTLKEGEMHLGKSLPGVGCLVLNEQKNFASVDEAGDLYLYGPFISSMKSQVKQLNINNRTFENVVKTEFKVKWTSDKKLQEISVKI